MYVASYIPTDTFHYIFFNIWSECDVSGRAGNDTVECSTSHDDDDDDIILNSKEIPHD